MAKKIKFFCSLQKKENKKQGRWTPEEQDRFLKGCYFFKNDWEKIKDYIKTRTIPQIRSHAQKYLIKICRKYSIKLTKKKFSNRLSKHLDITKIPYKGKTNISNMSIYEKNILEMFSYYNREVMNDEKLLTNIINNEPQFKKIEGFDKNENSINTDKKSNVNNLEYSSEKIINKDSKNIDIQNENMFCNINNDNLFSSINKLNTLPVLFPQNDLSNIQNIKSTNLSYISQNANMANMQLNNPLFNLNNNNLNFQGNQYLDLVYELPINFMNNFNQNKFFIQNEYEFYLMQKISYYNTLLLNNIKSNEKRNENILVMLGFDPNKNLNNSFLNTNINSFDKITK